MNDLALLVVRGILNHDKNSNGSSTHICPAVKDDGPLIVPFVGGHTFHSFASYLAGACALLSVIISFTAVAMHAVNYSNPVQQRQVIRIILLVPWVSLFAWLVVWQEGAGLYLARSLDFGCAVALAAFMLLLCDYILSAPGGFQELLGQTPAKNAQGQSQSPVWFKRSWYQALQFIPTSLIIWIATCISLALGTFCETSNDIHFAKIWLTVLAAIVTTAAVLADLRIYNKNKAVLRSHKILLKFIAFKGIIGLNALQMLVIGLLVTHSTIKPTQYMTYHDLYTALPSLILACEMPFFAILIFFAFPVKPYRSNAMGPAAGPFAAIVEALNITDLLSAFVRGPMRLVREQQWGIQRQMSMPLQGGGVMAGESHRLEADRV